MVMVVVGLMLPVAGGVADEACPLADLSGDHFVNFKDYAVLADWWLQDCNSLNHFCEGADFDLSGRVDPKDLAILTGDWLETCTPFVTTWDTSLGAGTTVTLALAGEVDAYIDWGDGSDPNYVTTPGPHVHDYGVDGTYTVSVTGSVTAYNSHSNGGAVSERKKLISVDNWGQLGFTSMYRAFSYCSNLVSVPPTSDGIEAVTDMGNMFGTALSRLGYLQRHRHERNVPHCVGIQPGHQRLGYLQRHRHVRDVPLCIDIQPGHRRLGYLQRHRHVLDVLRGVGVQR